MSVAKQPVMLNPAFLDPLKIAGAPSDFWLRLLNDEALNEYNGLEKILIGCELIAALDTVELLAA
jgi:hypothetical protein